MVDHPVMGMIVPKIARLSGFEVLNLILVMTNCLVVVAIFLGLAAAAKLTELPKSEGRTAEKVAKMVAIAEIATLQLDLVENSQTVVARSLGEVDLALRRRCSSLPFLAEF
jgi:hypothetical protein